MPSSYIRKNPMAATTREQKPCRVWVAAVVGVLVLAVVSAGVPSSASGGAAAVYDYLQCQVCRTPELSGDVTKDSCCNYETVDKAVDQHFHPLLTELSRLSFFRYFKVNLGKTCPFWQADNVCANRECGVCECPKEEVPVLWSKKDQEQKRRQQQPCDEQLGDSVLSKVDRNNANVGTTFNPWSEKVDQHVYSVQDDSDPEMVYINLLENPERYTGYSGLPAIRVWQAIYQENCFNPPPGKEVSLDGMCLEERVYYRLISGMQASINTHIAQEYKYGDESWGVNTPLYVDRVGKYPERLQNLYFTYLFVMRAVGRAKDVLLKYDYATGNSMEDARTVEIMKQLVHAKDYNSSCPVESQAVLKGFDENMLFRVKNTQHLSINDLAQARADKKRLEIQFRAKFQNISRIMDCVTCEKCRLWGKIQVMGIGTAIKILLIDDVNKLTALHRNEIIALINVLTRLSESVDGVRLFRRLEFEDAVMKFFYIIVFMVFCVLFIIALKRRRSSKLLKRKKLN